MSPSRGLPVELPLPSLSRAAPLLLLGPILVTPLFRWSNPAWIPPPFSPLWSRAPSVRCLSETHWWGPVEVGLISCPSLDSVSNWLTRLAGLSWGYTCGVLSRVWCSFPPHLELRPSEGLDCWLLIPQRSIHARSGPALVVVPRPIRARCLLRWAGLRQAPCWHPQPMHSRVSPSRSSSVGPAVAPPPHCLVPSDLALPRPWALRPPLWSVVPSVVAPGDCLVVGGMASPGQEYCFTALFSNFIIQFYFLIIACCINALEQFCLICF